MEITQREMFFTDEFLPKFSERCQMIVKCINEKTEIPEQDQIVLEEVHRLWNNGTFGWMKSTLPEVPQETVQGGLFAEQDNVDNNNSSTADKTSDSTSGTEVDNTTKETKKEE